MKLNSATYYWSFVFAFCFIAYQLIQDTIRPYYTGSSFITKYFLGVAPNFFPAIGIPALFVTLIPLVFKESKIWANQKKHQLANSISVIGLVSWEFTQTALDKARFDWNDILWTFIGALVFHFLWKVLPHP